MGRGTYELDKDRIRELALAKGLSLTELAEEAGLCASTLCTTRRSYPKTIKYIADALGVEPKEIIKE